MNPRRGIFMREKKYMPTLVILILSFIWGSTWLGIKLGIEAYPPFFCAGVRFLTAFLFLYAVIRFRGSPFPSDRKSIRIMIFIGLQQSVIYGLVFWAEQFIDSGISAVLFATMPAFILILSVFMYKEQPVLAAHGIGLILSFLGMIVIYDPQFIATETYLMGYAALVLSALVSSYMAVYVKVHAERIPALNNTAVQMLVAGLLLSMVSAVWEPWDRIEFSAVGAAAILYLGIVGSAIAFGLYMWVIKKVTPMEASVIPLMTPLVALIFGWLFLNEYIGPRTLAGSAMILTGVYFITVSRTEMGRVFRKFIKKSDSI